MLENYIINDQLLYEDHYLKVAQTDVQIGGVTGAALLSALLVDTEEGIRRGIAVDTEDEQMEWIRKYEKEVRRDEWGHLGAEVELLNNTYIELVTSEVGFSDLCPNVLLMDIALQLVNKYMNYLTIETFQYHIWECCTWEAPFAHWLMDAAMIETKRQQFLHTNWLEPEKVYALFEKITQDSDATKEKPTLIFEGEDAADIYKRYFNWVWKQYQQQIREIPGAQPRSAKHRNKLVELETDWTEINKLAQTLDEDQRQLWAQWMFNWQKFITKRLKPPKTVLFWEKDVPEKQITQLTHFLRLQEKEWNYFKTLSAAIYALRQLGYVRRACSVRDITRWMTEQLTKDYSTKNNRDQFLRAWKELGRYTDEVKECVELLESYGVTHFGNKKAKK